MKKIIILTLFLASLIGTLFLTPASYAGPTIFVNLGPYGAVSYPAGYAYPVNNGCAYPYPSNAYYNPYYNNYPVSVNNTAFNNPYVFDNTNVNVGRIVPTHMNPRNPYGY